MSCWCIGKTKIVVHTIDMMVRCLLFGCCCYESGGLEQDDDDDDDDGQHIFLLRLLLPCSLFGPCSSSLLPTIIYYCNNPLATSASLPSLSPYLPTTIYLLLLSLKYHASIPSPSFHISHTHTDTQTHTHTHTDTHTHTHTPTHLPTHTLSLTYPQITSQLEVLIINLMRAGQK